MPKKDLFDFIQSYGKHVKKPLGLSGRDQGVIKALEACPDGVLEDEKKLAGVSRRIKHLPPMENKSSENRSGNQSDSISHQDSSHPSLTNKKQKPGANKEKFT